MDWHKLQHTLFEMDPTDPREDLRKLQAQAQGGAVGDIPPTKDYVAESVDVPQGSMPLGLDSIADFAALAGVRLDEKQKIGSAGQAKGKEPMPSTSKPSKTGEQPHPLKDKLVGEADDTMDFIKQQAKQGWKNYNKLDAISTGLPDEPKAKVDTKKVKAPTAAQPAETSNLSPALQSKLAPYADQLERVFGDAKATRLWAENLNRLAPPKKQEEGIKQPSLKPRDPNAQTLNDLRKSGAMGAHKDKKKDMKSGKVKHKSKQYESIRDELWAKLNASSKS
jgi:hypothetical protein